MHALNLSSCVGFLATKWAFTFSRHVNHLSGVWKELHSQKWGAKRQEGCFLSPFVHRWEAAHPVRIYVVLKLIPDTAMLFTPFKYTHPPPLSCPPRKLPKWHHVVECLMPSTDSYIQESANLLMSVICISALVSGVSLASQPGQNREQYLPGSFFQSVGHN